MLAAVCILIGNLTFGMIHLQQQQVPGPVTLTGEIKGLTPGQHGFHVHQYGDLSDGCTSAGGHYNPFNKTHGGPNSSERHVGDLGNVLADANGVAQIKITDSIVQLDGQYSVVGRSLVIHSGEDDLGLGGTNVSSTTGNSGSRVGCCVIGWSQC